MKLYYTPGACSLSPHIVALEAGIPVELVKVDIKTKTVRNEGDYWAMSAICRSVDTKRAFVCPMRRIKSLCSYRQRFFAAALRSMLYAALRTYGSRRKI